ncbi:MAG: CsgG/HfaB family protein [Rhodothermales bacterium]|nr:CsgG/HfaB family protein [Rhodothermales bacterium]
MLRAVLLISVLMAGCATVKTEHDPQAFETADVSRPFPAYDGPKARIQVVRFGIPEEIARRYQELEDRRVGFGLSNRLVETFFDTGRFEFIEEKDAMQERMAEQWVLRQGGIYAEDEPIGPEDGLTAPKYLVYAEVYDFAVSNAETVRGVASEQQKTTIVGVQIRFVDVDTGEYVPASGRGEATSVASGVWVSPDLPFDQSTVGLASQRALNVAVRNLIDRLEAQR